MADPLIAVRAIHFATTAMVAGVVFFEWLVAAPAFKRVGAAPLLATVVPFQSRMAHMLRGSLAVAVISGAAWLLLLAARIADRSVSEVVADGTAWIVLTQTRFGLDWQLRLLLALLLCGYPPLLKSKSAALSICYALVAAAFLGALAWAGHGGATPGTDGYIHVTADFVHLIAIGAWLGGLMPLVVLLKQLRRSAEECWAKMACDITRRFSNLGIVAVGTVLVSGSFNTWFLVGSVSGLFGTNYGRLLLLKIVLFGAMVCLAAVNRLRLMPSLSRATDDRSGNPDASTVRALERNAIIEILLGLAVITVVAMLGVTPPASELHFHVH